MERSYRYLGYFFLLFIPLVAIAFHKNYGSKFPDFEPGYDVTIHIHAFFASIWLLMLIVQPLLITYKKLAWHRLQGKISYVILPLLVLSFFPGIWKVIKEGEYKYAFFAAADCVVLIIMYSLAMIYKKESAKHMRYIIVSSLTLLGPTLGRIGPRYFDLDIVTAQMAQYVVQFLILFGLILYDRAHGRDSRPYWIGVGVFVIHTVVFLLLFAMD